MSFTKRLVDWTTASGHIKHTTPGDGRGDSDSRHSLVGLPAAAHWTGDPLKPVTLFSDDGDTQVVFMGISVY